MLQEVVLEVVLLEIVFQNSTINYIKRVKWGLKFYSSIHVKTALKPGDLRVPVSVLVPDT